MLALSPLEGLVICSPQHLVCRSYSPGNCASCNPYRRGRLQKFNPLRDFSYGFCWRWKPSINRERSLPDHTTSKVSATPTQLLCSRYLVQVNSCPEDTMPMYGFAVRTKPLVRRTLRVSLTTRGHAVL